MAGSFEPSSPAVDGAGAPAWAVSLLLTSVGLWIGAAVFLSAGVLPLLFVNLDSAEAGRIAALVFPLYFRAGLVLGVVATLAAAVVARGGGRRWTAVVVALAVMTLAQGWSAVVIHPEMAAIRGIDAEVARFQQLHELSVRLNSIVLVGGAVLLLGSGLLFTRSRGRS